MVHGAARPRHLSRHPDIYLDTPTSISTPRHLSRRRQVSRLLHASALGSFRNRTGARLERKGAIAENVGRAVGVRSTRSRRDESHARAAEPFVRVATQAAPAALRRRPALRHPDRDDKYGPEFDRAAAGVEQEFSRRPCAPRKRTPRANVFWEVCDDSALITFSFLANGHLLAVLAEYGALTRPE
jgi:hypothetical protein